MSLFSTIRRAASAGVGRMIEARERQVRKYVDQTLLHFDEGTLKAAGLSRADIQRRSKVFF